MKNRPRFWNICWALAVIAIPLAGCTGTSQSVEFYTLSPMTRLQQEPHAGAIGQDIAIGVGPVEFPKFLDRPQIVTRTSANRIEVSEFHRWGGSLRADFLRVLADNIAILLGTRRVALYPWGDRFDPTYRIALDVEQFEGRLGEYVQLDVTWTVTGRQAKETLLVKKAMLREPLATDDYEALVAAKSRVLASLSRKIADEIRRLVDTDQGDNQGTGDEHAAREVS
jgi:uncharacterized lipoprotein YmbA